MEQEIKRANLLTALDTIVIGSFFDSSFHSMEIIHACITQYYNASSCGDVAIIRRINQLIFTWNSRCATKGTIPYLLPIERIGPECFSEETIRKLYETYYSLYLVGYYSNREAVHQRLMCNIGVHTAFVIDKTTLRYPRGMAMPSRSLASRPLPNNNRRVTFAPVFTMKMRPRNRHVNDRRIKFAVPPSSS